MAFQKKKWVRTYDPKGLEPFRVSRSKIDLFRECPRCFYLETRLGVKRPDTYPLTLNIAVDALLKREFDTYRAKGLIHPMMKAQSINAIPFAHKDINTWRENFVGVQHHHTPSNLLVFGAVDDIWVNPQGELIVVDYKATAKKETPNLLGELGAQYKRQMEVYQWLLRQNGFTVSSTGYFFYVNGKKELQHFEGKLEFDTTILPCVGDTSWIEPMLIQIKKTLESPDIPAMDEGCKYCLYREETGKVFRASVLKKSSEKSTRQNPKKKETNVPTQNKTLF